MTYVTSDLHLQHKNILEYEANDFSSVEEHDETIIENWNHTVSRNDTVIVAGDVAFCSKTKTSELVHRLCGNKILIYGNHDCSRSIEFWIKAGFLSASRYPILYDGVVISHRPPNMVLDAMVYMYGHVHTNTNFATVTSNTACICTSRWGFMPVKLEFLKKCMRASRCCSRHVL